VESQLEEQLLLLLLLLLLLQPLPQLGPLLLLQHWQLQ
jgi:hypothetical protein